MSSFRRCLIPAAASLCVVVSACSESPTATISTLNSAPSNSLQMVRCNVDATARTMECVPAVQTPLGIAADLIVGGQNTYVTLASTNLVTTATVSVTADVTVRNRTNQPMSTTTGLAASATGVNVFFVTLPNNGVTVTNPNGTNGTFTAAGQTFFQYTGTDLNVGTDPVTGQLVPGETSAVKNWQFALNGATTFSFVAAVSTPVPAETGVLRVAALSPAPAAVGRKIWASSASDIFVIPSAGVTAQSTILHYDGTNWLTSLGLTGTANTWNGIHGLSGTDVWVVGNAVSSSGQIRHYTGGANFAPETSNTTANLLGVWAASATSVWAVGSGGKILHRSGGVWAEVTSPTATTLNAIWGLSDTNIFAAGNSGVFAHWDGTTWTTITSGANNYTGMWGAHNDSIWAVGGSGAANIKRCSFSPTLACASVTSNTTAVLADVSGTSSSSVFAVGTAVSVYGVTNGTLLRFNGSAWSNMTSGVTTALTNVFALTGTDVYMDGASSVYLRGIR